MLEKISCFFYYTGILQLNLAISFSNYLSNLNKKLTKNEDNESIEKYLLKKIDEMKSNENGIQSNYKGKTWH